MTEQKQFVVDENEFRKKLDKLNPYQTPGGTDMVPYSAVTGFLELCRLPIQPSARLDAAIRLLKAGTRVKDGYFSLTYKECIDLLLWATGQPQDTWTDKDFGLEEEK